MQVDLERLALIISGTKVLGLAKSCDMMLPAKKPEGVLVTCEHLSLDDKDLMSKGSVWDAEDYFIKFILCKACVIVAQHFPVEGGFQAQARICPICIDDHSENRPCRNADLIDRIYALEEQLAVTRVAAQHYIEDRGPQEKHHVETMVFEDVLDKGRQSESYEFYLKQLKGKPSE